VDIDAQAACDPARATVATPGEWQCKTARSGEWAQHFSNASCLQIKKLLIDCHEI